MQISGLIFMVAIILSRFINVRAYRQLNVVEKVRLIDEFAIQRMYWSMILFVAIGIYWILATQTAMRLADLTIGYVAFLLIYVVVRAIVNRWKMRNIGLPPQFQHQYILAQVLSLLGTACLCFAIVC